MISCICGGTGSSGSAGYSGVFALKRSGTTFICAVIGAKNSDMRFSIASQMLEYSFSAYKTVTLLQKGEVVHTNMNVRGGSESTLDIIVAQDIVLLLKQNEAYERSLNLPEYIDAPVLLDTPISTVEYVGSSGDIVAKAELFAKQAVDKATVWGYVVRCMKAWLHC